MSDETTTAPETTDNAADQNDDGKGTFLTDGEDAETQESTQESTTPLAKDGQPQLPHAWMKGLTTEQKADADLIKELSKFEKGIPDLAKSYVELEKKAGQALAVPNEDATDEEKAAFRKAIGVPDKPEDYKLEKVSLPDGVQVDEGMQSEYLTKAHALGLNQDQAAKLHSWYMQTLGKQVVDARRIVKTTVDEAGDAFRERWGANADAAQVQLERAFARFATPGMVAKLKTSNLGNDADFIDPWVKVGQMMTEHNIVDADRDEGEEVGQVGKRTFAQLAANVYPSKKE